MKIVQNKDGSWDYVSTVREQIDEEVIERAFEIVEPSGIINEVVVIEIKDMLNVQMTRLTQLEEILAIQCDDGNWNYDPYMLGLANGLIMSESIMKETDPQFLEEPEDGWLKDKKGGVLGRCWKWLKEKRYSLMRCVVNEIHG